MSSDSCSESCEGSDHYTKGQRFTKKEQEALRVKLQYRGERKQKELIQEQDGVSQIRMY